MGQHTHLYKNIKWYKIRSVQLKKYPLCSMCEAIGRVEQARVVDHINPHRGDLNIFYDSSNVQSLCKHCHDSHKQRLERSGVLSGCDRDGNPVDPNHHWNK